MCMLEAYACGCGAGASLYTCMRARTDLHVYVTNQCFRFTLQYDPLNSDVHSNLLIMKQEQPKTCYTLSIIHYPYWMWNCANIDSWSPLAPLPFFLQVALLQIWHDRNVYNMGSWHFKPQNQLEMKLKDITVEVIFLTEYLTWQHGCQINESVSNETLNFSVYWITLYYIHGSIFLT